MATKVRTQEKVTVTLSERKPFLMLYKNGTPKGLDVLVIENFARNNNLQIDYYIINTFENTNFNEKFSTQTNSRYSLRYI